MARDRRTARASGGYPLGTGRGLERDDHERPIERQIKQFAAVGAPLWLHTTGARNLALLRELGGRFQVLCITHLAPIAARATTQCAVEKRVAGGRTMTVVTRLGDDDRVGELSRMIAGSRASDATRASAREMLGASSGAGAKVKQEAKGESESPRPRP